MKRLTFLSILILLGATVWLLTGCTKSESSSDSRIHSYLIDVTSHEVLAPHAEEVRDRFGFEDDLYQGGTVRISVISHGIYTEAAELEVPPVSSWLTNERDRIYEVRTFLDGIDTALAGISSEAAGRTHSEVVRRIARELEVLSARSGKRTLTIYSDLMEHRDGMSMYHQGVMHRLTTAPDRLARDLFSDTDLPDLTGIEVRLIGPGPTRAEALRFESLAAVYADVLEDHGARVTIQTIGP